MLYQVHLTMTMTRNKRQCATHVASRASQYKKSLTILKGLSRSVNWRPNEKWQKNNDWETWAPLQLQVNSGAPEWVGISFSTIVSALLSCWYSQRSPERSMGHIACALYKQAFTLLIVFCYLILGSRIHSFELRISLTTSLNICNGVLTINKFNFDYYDVFV